MEGGVRRRRRRRRKALGDGEGFKKMYINKILMREKKMKGDRGEEGLMG